jgi:hypothetical protein
MNRAWSEDTKNAGVGRLAERTSCWGDQTETNATETPPNEATSPPETATGARISEREGVG